jgi:hypothetical protein
VGGGAARHSRSAASVSWNVSAIRRQLAERLLDQCAAARETLARIRLEASSPSVMRR